MPRFAVCALLFVASGVLVGQRGTPLVAQDKKDAKDRAAMLEKQVAALKQDLALANTQITALRADLLQGAKEFAQQKAANGKLQADNAALDAALKKERADGAKDDKTIKELQTALDGWRKAGLVHVVILKLKEDSPANEVQSLIDDAYSQLAKAKGVRGLWAGRPAAKVKADAPPDYTVALVIAFDDAAGLKAYLKDAAHDKFAEKHLKKWEPPTAYDFEPKKAP